MKAFREMRSCIETNSLLRVLEPQVRQLVSLKFLVKQYLNCNLVKTQQVSDWGQVKISNSSMSPKIKAYNFMIRGH